MLTPSVCPPRPSTECSRAVMEGLCGLDLNGGISMDFNNVWWNIQWGEGANLSAYLPWPLPQTSNTFQLEGASLLHKSSLVVWSKAEVATTLTGENQLLCHFNQFGRPCDPWQCCWNFGFGKMPKWPWQHIFFGTKGRFLWDIRRDCTLELISFKLRKTSFRLLRDFFFYFYAIYLWFFQWFWQLTKIAVTSVTFRCLEMTHDPWLPNWSVFVHWAHE